MRRKKIPLNIILSLLILAVIILFVMRPKVGMQACFDGVSVWAKSLLPALFPFFILTGLLTHLGVVEKLSKKISKLTSVVFGCSGVSSYVYLMSILSGYPVGAKITADLYLNNTITSKEAIKITTFTSTSGPLFIIGTVGIAMFNSFYLGLIVLIAHFVGAILNGVLFRSYKISEQDNFNVQTMDLNLEDIMLSSIKSILIIGGYVAIFFVLIAIIESYHIFDPLVWGLSKILGLCGLNNISASAIISGVLEVTKGCLVLSTAKLPLKVSAIIATFLISFGGLCIHAQAFTFLRKFGMKYRLFVLIKLCHALLASLVAIPLVFVLL